MAGLPAPWPHPARSGRATPFCARRAPAARDRPYLFPAVVRACVRDQGAARRVCARRASGRAVLRRHPGLLAARFLPGGREAGEADAAAWRRPALRAASTGRRRSSATRSTCFEATDSATTETVGWLRCMHGSQRSFDARMSVAKLRRSKKKHGGCFTTFSSSCFFFKFKLRHIVFR